MISKSLEKKLADAAKETGFTKALPLLREEARECLVLGATKRGGKPPIGASRIGGRPDLPESVDWPAGLNAKGKPFGHASFLAQLNFEEIPRLADLPFPRKGMLWIFGRAWNDDVALAPIFLADPGRLAARTPPAKDLGGEKGRRAPQPGEPTVLRFTRGVSLPVCSGSFRKAIEAQADGPEPSPYQLHAALQPAEYRGRLGGYSFIDEHDLYRAIAFRELGRPEYRFADYWDTMDEYEQLLALPTPRASELRPVFEKIQKHRASLRPKVEWIDQHRAAIARGGVVATAPLPPQRLRPPRPRLRLLARHLHPRRRARPRRLRPPPRGSADGVLALVALGWKKHHPLARYSGRFLTGVSVRVRTQVNVGAIIQSRGAAHQSVP